MAAIEGALLRWITNFGDGFQRQNLDFRGGPVAGGLRWICKTGRGLALVADLLEGLCCLRNSVIYRNGFSSAANYNVEYLSLFDINVLPGLCPYEYGTF
ncbi:chaperone DnaJ-domain superfamily protein [Actinidia rufa]|uniref:Chaperone DnaJ-domain superfamily protein n=1 Tax=Actinidia rufa TaxID=165716 RepID=A0A7J0E0P3_9ERIC|nr:chaperone DnaJ-domain superfamily protein [Actinidia rufa]